MYQKLPHSKHRGTKIEASWKRPGLGPSRKLLGVSGAVLGTSWNLLGVAESRIGDVLEPSEAVLARLWNVLKPIFLQNGATLVHSILALNFD